MKTDDFSSLELFTIRVPCPIWWELNFKSGQLLTRPTLVYGVVDGVHGCHCRDWGFDPPLPRFLLIIQAGWQIRQATSIKKTLIASACLSSHNLNGMHCLKGDLSRVSRSATSEKISLLLLTSPQIFTFRLQAEASKVSKKPIVINAPVVTVLTSAFLTQLVFKIGKNCFC